MTKEEALAELEKPIYNPEELKNDMEYVIKKLGLTNAEFDQIMKTPLRHHHEFRSDLKWKDMYLNLLRKTSNFRKFFKKSS